MIRRIYNSLSYRYWQFIKYHFPFKWVRYLYKVELGKRTDFSKPRDLNEKIQWLEFYTDTRLWSVLADKYAVRSYVEKRVGEQYLTKLLGRWINADDIDFNDLPEKFVIKPNNGSYDVIVVTSKKNVNLDEVRKKLSRSLSNPFGYDNGEPHYLRIKPCIIAEELLETTQEEGLVDYKVWCFHGVPHLIFACFNRNPVTHHADFMVYDLDWHRHPEYLAPEFRSESHCPKPRNFEQMLSVASKLSDGLPQCRVDLYNLDGKIIFGEMTLTSNYGMMPYFTQEILNEMGDMCVLPKRGCKEKMVCLLRRSFPRFW